LVHAALPERAGPVSTQRREVSPEEAALAARAHAGDLDAFGQLVDRYGEQARRVARAVLGNPDDGDDAAQDAFLSALKNLGRYDPQRPFGPWLMRIVANAAVDRRRRKRVRTAETLSPTLPSGGPGPASETDRRAMLSVLEEALQQLPERQRLAVTLFDVEGYAHAEIAELMNVPQGTVRSDVFHARRALRRALQPWREWKEEIS
jgi:RNA polymerase sigma-70 factor, ECF subfamily